MSPPAIALHGADGRVDLEMQAVSSVQPLRQPVSDGGRSAAFMPLQRGIRRKRRAFLSVREQPNIEAA
jgi:hypothetical protein